MVIKSNFNRSNQSGDTLLELTIGLGIFVILSTLVTYIAIDGWQAFQTLQIRGALQTELEQATIRIDQFARKATSLPEQLTAREILYISSPTTLILTVPSVSSDGSTIQGSTDSVVFVERPEGLFEVIEAGGGVRGSSDRQIVAAPNSTEFSLISTLTKPLITTTLSANRATTHQTLTRSVSSTSLTRNAQ